MSIKINQLEERHNSYPLVCRRPAETVSLQRIQICYRWGTPAYWSLVPRSSMFYLFEFCLKNMWNCSLRQQILSHSFYDWKLYELFLLSGFLIIYKIKMIFFKIGTPGKHHCCSPVDKCYVPCLYGSASVYAFRNYNLDRKLITQIWSWWKHKKKTRK